MNVARDLARGTLVLHYRIEAVLGRGGVGVVYLADDLRLKRRVALKVLSPALADDERFRKRFLSESELAASLDHGNVIPIYEAGEADGSLFIAMRYVEGSDLRSLLGEGPLSEEQAVAVCGQIGGALDAAHERGLVHGDVKPSNVLIDQRGHAYLADFGLTKHIAEEGSAEAEPQLMGTIDYVAPELIRGEETDGRADVYSLGCLLYECLTGRQPYRRGNDAATLYAHLEDEPPQIGSPADPVLAKALAKTPDERYQTCAELTGEARQALGIATPRRARLPIAVAVAAILVAAAALAAFFLLRGGGSNASPLTGRLLQIDASANRVRDSVRVGGSPDGVAIGDGRVWVTTRQGPGIWSVDPAGLTATPLAADSAPLGIALDDRFGYVAEDNGDVARIDLRYGSTVPGVPVGVPVGGASVIASGPAGVWVANGNAALHVTSVSASAGKEVTQTPLPDESLDDAHVRLGATGAAVGQDAVWVTGDALDDRLYRIDPRTARVVSTVLLPFVPSAVAAGYGSVWVTAQLADAVAQVDPQTGRIVRMVRVGREPMAVAGGAGGIWVANALDGTVSRIDPRTGRVTAVVRVGGSPQALAAHGSTLWVASDDA